MFVQIEGPRGSWRAGLSKELAERFAASCHGSDYGMFEYEEPEPLMEVYDKFQRVMHILQCMRETVGAYNENELVFIPGGLIEIACSLMDDYIAQTIIDVLHSVAISPLATIVLLPPSTMCIDSLKSNPHECNLQVADITQKKNKIHYWVRPPGMQPHYRMRWDKWTGKKLIIDKFVDSDAISECETFIKELLPTSK